MAGASQQLAEQQRLMQLQVRTQALRDFLLLWPLWTGDEQTFAQLVQATKPLVTVYRNASSTVASAYYNSARTEEQIAGNFAARLADPVPEEQLVSSLYVTGQVAARDALGSGQSPVQARQIALTRVSGAVSRHVLNGGRETILGSVQGDAKALGWARITDGNPCAFCMTLASRGAVYKTEETASFEAHDHCGCAAMAVWTRDTTIPNLDRWQKTYDQAQQFGLDEKLLQHGENTSAARLNAVRRYLAVVN
jgi:hypothetical protein